jgi:hypothetical protein
MSDRLGLIYAYTRALGPCPCGEKRGHTGWLVCALNLNSPTPGSSASSQETHAEVPQKP